MKLMNKIVPLVVLVGLFLAVSLNAKLVAQGGCSDSEKEIDQITWALAVATLVIWVISVLAIVFNSGLGFRFEKFLSVAGEYILLTAFGSLVVPAMVVSRGEEDGKIDSNLNNMAVVGLIMGLWLALSTFTDVMFNRKLYNQLTKFLGIKN